MDAAEQFSPAAGRLAFQTLPSQTAVGLLPAYAASYLVCLRTSRISWVHRFFGDLIIHQAWWVTNSASKGPRSGPGYSVLVGQRFVGPIRPTRGQIATSPLGGLYAGVATGLAAPVPATENVRDSMKCFRTDSQTPVIILYGGWKVESFLGS